VTVRIEGKEKTLFEGPIMTEGHAVQASSDTAPRRCDGTNLGAHPEPGPTATAAAVDAMELVGQTFDAEWYGEEFDDYFLTRFGPDEQNTTTGAYWGVLSDGTFTPIGGCQYQERAGDEVLWQYDAFSARRFLWLAAESDPTLAPATPRPTAYVEVGEPLRLLVESYEGSGSPAQRAEGVTVAPVDTEPLTGFQTVETDDAAAVTSNSEGSAEVTFSTPGWHRLKAQDEVGYFRSNALDVCAEPEGGGGCGPLPEDATVRTPDRYKPAVVPPSPPVVIETTRSAPAGTDTKPPSNAVSFGSAVADRKRGQVRLNVAIPGAGVLGLTGPGVTGQSRDLSNGGIVVLTVKPTARLRKSLREKGKVRVEVTATFTPTGGTTGSAGRTVTLRFASPKS
jgi:hypothetical protein